MKVYPLLIIICLFINVFSLFAKYGHEEINTNKAYFDAREFNEGDEMHFKIEAWIHAYKSSDIIEYYYVYNDLDESNSKKYQVSFSSSTRFTEDYQDYFRKYFTIKKKKSEFGDAAEGNYLVIVLPLYSNYWIYIENAEEDEGKFPTWAIVLIVIIGVLFIAGIIFYCCYIRKKRMQIMAQTNAATVGVATAAANYATQQNIQAQVYQAQVNQVQAHAYQAQMNAPQTYSQQNYQAPVNSNDVGYSSKAIM